jgi:hypothetical protein
MRSGIRADAQRDDRTCAQGYGGGILAAGGYLAEIMSAGARSCAESLQTCAQLVENCLNYDPFGDLSC